MFKKIITSAKKALKGEEKLWVVFWLWGIVPPILLFLFLIVFERYSHSYAWSKITFFLTAFIQFIICVFLFIGFRRAKWFLQILIFVYSVAIFFHSLFFFATVSKYALKEESMLLWVLMISKIIPF